VAQIDALASAASAAGSAVDVFVEIDVGQGRCGVRDASEALRLAERIAKHAPLKFRGLQAYHGASSICAAGPSVVTPPHGLPSAPVVSSHASAQSACAVTW
jgi:D-serine deaminase-like pyridoxal phosphate-dependent protein